MFPKEIIRRQLSDHYWSDCLMRRRSKARTRKADGDEYGRALLLSLDQKYNNDWENLSKDEQTAGRRRHFELWKKYECFDLAIQQLPAGANVLDGTFVDKTEPDPTDAKKKRKRGKSRFCPRGFKDKQKNELRTDAPTVGLTALLTTEAYMQSLWEDDNPVASAIVDVSAAFYQGLRTCRSKTLYMKAPWEWVQPLQSAGYLKEYDSKRPVYLRLTKEVPGTVAGPRMWFLNLDDRLLSFHLPVKGGGHLSISRSHKPAVYLICERSESGDFKRVNGNSNRGRIGIRIERASTDVRINNSDSKRVNGNSNRRQTGMKRPSNPSDLLDSATQLY